MLNPFEMPKPENPMMTFKLYGSRIERPEGKFVELTHADILDEKGEMLTTENEVIKSMLVASSYLVIDLCQRTGDFESSLIRFNEFIIECRREQEALQPLVDDTDES